MKNESGIHPCGNHILVKPDSIEETYDGLLEIPDEIKKRHQMSISYGTLIAVGPDCFTHSVEETERWIDNRWVPHTKTVIKYSEPFAEPGDRISFAIHSGRECVGIDGEDYRAMNDTDITALVDEGVIATNLEARRPVSN